MTPYEECKRIQAECDAAGKPYPWAKPYKLIASGDCIVDGLSIHPMTRQVCPKCRYTLTTNEAPQKGKCPNDGEVLEGVAYP